MPRAPAASTPQASANAASAEPDSDANTIPESLADAEPQNDEWATLIPGRPWPTAARGETLYVSESSNLELERAPSPEGRQRLKRAAERDRALLSISWARAPSGEVWTCLTHVEAQEEMVTQASWHLEVERASGVLRSEPRRFEINAGACRDNARDCLGTHRWGLSSPTQFWFVDLDGDRVTEAFALGTEERSTAQAHEYSFTLWQLGAKSLELHELSRRSALFGLRDCNGDGRPEVALNPYRTAGDEFSVEYGYRRRASARNWSLLAEATPRGEFKVDGPLGLGYAKQLCPTVEAQPFQARAGLWAERVHCAKLWGASAEQLRQALESSLQRPARRRSPLRVPKQSSRTPAHD
ncbi:MAG: hypothetical protein QM756_15530 [Polyangiaceae bacterium]